MKPTICTYSGIEFDLLNPKPSMVKLVDIIHSLSHQCRFTGHIQKFYSIAQHSVYVYQLCSGTNDLEGLLHDAPEAYIGDVSKPLKMLLPDYKIIEQRITETVSEALGIDLVNLPQRVKEMDYFALKVEQANFMPKTDWWYIDEEASKRKIQAWNAEHSKYIFGEVLRSHKPEWF